MSTAAAAAAAAVHWSTHQFQHQMLQLATPSSSCSCFLSARFSIFAWSLCSAKSSLDTREGGGGRVKEVDWEGDWRRRLSWTMRELGVAGQAVTCA